jgi:hypothetical protein
MEFYKAIYLDRFMESSSSLVGSRREKAMKLRSEKAYAHSLLQSNTIRHAKTLQTPLELCEASLSILVHDSDSKEALEMIPQMAQVIETIKEQNKSSQRKMHQLDYAISDLYSDMTKNRYNLHAVFMHEGEASFGHYWIYIWHPDKKKWFKYNDSIVSEVRFDQAYF